MVRFLLVFLIGLFTQVSLAQEQKEENYILFSEALSMHLPKYEKKAKAAYRHRNYEEATFLFDSLVEYGLNGSYMDEFRFYKLNGKPISLYDFKKPVYLITYASWCVTTKGEIPALNQLAEKYKDKIDFVIIFWDEQKVARKASRDFNSAINVLFVDELDNKDAFVIKQLKHSLGLPTTFLLDKNKMILDIRRGVNHPFHKDFQESLDINYESIYDGIANLLLGNNDYKELTGPFTAAN